MIGWIKLHRAVLDWEWYDDPKVFRVFLHCLLKANHIDKRYKGILIKRGSFITGLDVFSSECKVSVQSLRTAFYKLKSTNEITIKSNSKGTEIQIVNYDKYQQSTSESTNQQQTNNKPTTTTKKEKNDKEVKKKMFLQFWDKYPKKVAKQDSQKKFINLKLNEVNEIMNTVDKFIRFKPFDSYVHPNPLTYLNQRRWEDESSQPIKIKSWGKK